MLSPVLFNLYLEIMFRKALSKVDGSVKVNDYNIVANNCPVRIERLRSHYRHSRYLVNCKAYHISPGKTLSISSSIVIL